MLLSPVEPWDALVIRIDDAITKGASDDELDMWVQAVLSAPMAMVKCASVEDANWKRIAEREAFGHGFELLCQTAIGRAFEVMDVISKEEAARNREFNAAHVANLWSSRVQQSGVGDEVNAGYTEILPNCKRRVFSDAAATQKLLWAGEHWGIATTPWDSLYKVDVLATKLGPQKNSTKLNWMIDFVHDRLLSGAAEKR